MPTKLSTIKSKVEELLAKFLVQDAQIRAIQNEGGIRVEIETNESALLIGFEGRNLEALQLILSQVLCGELKDGEKLVVDVGGYREAQDASFMRKIKSIAQKVKKYKLPQILEPMNSYQRRLAHMAVAEIEGVATKSEGEEPNRRIIIEPK